MNNPSKRTETYNNNTEVVNRSSRDNRRIAPKPLIVETDDCKDDGISYLDSPRNRPVHLSKNILASSRTPHNLSNVLAKTNPVYVSDYISKNLFSPKNTLSKVNQSTFDLGEIEQPERTENSSQTESVLDREREVELVNLVRKRNNDKTIPISGENEGTSEAKLKALKTSQEEETMKGLRSVCQSPRPSLPLHLSAISRLEQQKEMYEQLRRIQKAEREGRESGIGRDIEGLTDMAYMDKDRALMTGTIFGEREERREVTDGAGSDNSSMRFNQQNTNYQRLDDQSLTERGDKEHTDGVSDQVKSIGNSGIKRPAPSRTPISSHVVRRREQNVHVTTPFPHLPNVFFPEGSGHSTSDVNPYSNTVLNRTGLGSGVGVGNVTSGEKVPVSGAKGSLRNLALSRKAQLNSKTSITGGTGNDTSNSTTSGTITSTSQTDGSADTTNTPGVNKN